MLALAWGACGAPEPPPPPEIAWVEIVDEPLPPPEPIWPEPGARLSPPQPAYSRGFGVRKVYLDAGHGSAGSHGNTGCRCQLEEVEVLREAVAVAEVLTETGHFEVRVSREGSSRRSYSRRRAEAAAWGAEALVSLHTDVRMVELGTEWEPEPGKTCPRLDGEAGFAVLWSDEGTEELVQDRHALARAVGRRLWETGFPGYPGFAWSPVYEADALVTGVYVDRHAPGRRLYMLRRPTMPSVIVETHHAWYLAEVERWDEPATVRAFGLALAAALVDVLPPVPPGTALADAHPPTP